LYLGLNLNSHQLETRRLHNLLEDNYGAGSDFSYAEFENDLYTYGSGFSFQLGAIYKPTDKIRMGLSYQSPTWYSLTDELSQFIITSENNETDTIDPGVINIYEYKFSTPAEMSAGLAYIFGKNGLISAQYDLSNYQNTSFNINHGDVNFINQNNEIASNLKSAGTLKLGGEYRISRFSIRAGYFNQKSIHKAFQDSYNGSSIGIGYDFGGSALNLALSRVESQRSEPLFDSGLTDLVGIKNNQSQFLISYSMKL
jgi:long-subunit fatty acid transport protein